MQILIGVTGGIAAYKALELVRLFIKQGSQVQVVMTEGAKAFIQPLSFQALSGNPVRDSLFDENQEAGMGHIELARWADLIVIAPASAETMAKLRMGRANDLLTTLCLATEKPIMIAPSMNRLMWANEATQENVAVLRQRGLQVLEPEEGEQACGEVGTGRMPEPTSICEQALVFLKHQEQASQDREALQKFWSGKKVLITAGPTYEDIDPVRFIGNKSSGKMGFALAESAESLGASVTLISGPVALVTPLNVERIKVRSAEAMFTEVKAQYQKADYFISAAAVADYRINTPSEQKLKKVASEDTLTLELTKNPDIVAWVASQKDKPIVIGFAAETQNVLAYAKQKLVAKGLDMICANTVGDLQGFEVEDNQLTLITPNTEHTLKRSSKKQQAIALLSFISTTL